LKKFLSKTNVSFTQIGTYVYKLKVTDNNNISTSGTITVMVITSTSSSRQTAKLFPTNLSNPPSLLGSQFVHGYLEYLPDDYLTNPTQKYPVLIFLHGLGEIGNGTTDLYKLTGNGPPKLISQNLWPSSFLSSGNSYKFIVISPQSAVFWQSYDVDYVVQQVKILYGSRIDPSRIYLTGLSAGGGGVFQYLAASPYAGKNITAVVTCSAASSPGNSIRVNNVVTTNIPIWAFTNESDPTVPVTSSKAWVDSVNNRNINPPAKLTVYAGINGHDSWTATYDPSSTNPNGIYSWMLGYARTGAVPYPHPLANAGGGQTITLPSNANIDAGASKAISGSLVAYKWEKILGPTGDIINSPNTFNTKISFAQAGVYGYQVTVTDSHGLSDIATVQIIVNSALNKSFTSFTKTFQTNLDSSNLSEWNLYPNPVFGISTITIPSWVQSPLKISVFDKSGTRLFQKTEDHLRSNLQVDLSFLQTGFYLMQFEYKGNKNVISFLKK
jgi:poly(3-hydroxybutyrate) depolymerase